LSIVDIILYQTDDEDNYFLYAIRDNKKLLVLF